MTHLLPKQEKQNEGRILISCPDRPGIVTAVSGFLYEWGANIIRSDQHTTDPAGGHFFMRIAFQMEDLDRRYAELNVAFRETADRFHMMWRMSRPSQPKRMAIFASKEEHCLVDLLWRWQIGELNADIVMVVSNHRELEGWVAPLGIPYHHVPCTRQTRLEAEEKHLQLLEEAAVDMVVLARYMQIIPSAMVERYRHRMINIHHSFLPAFVGANPYKQADERGVKIIGATAHYVTEDLDEGPIIEQSVERVDHRFSVNDLKRTGRDVERLVLARAVQWHVNDEVLVYGNKTVVFG
jgi:formyltetrahydrofolate deformylase